MTTKQRNIDMDERYVDAKDKITRLEKLVAAYRAEAEAAHEITESSFIEIEDREAYKAAHAARLKLEELQDD